MSHTGARQGTRILLVDDDADVREMMACALKSEGLQVSEAANGVEALSLFTQDPFDLIITDFEMPRMRGDELVEKTRRLVPHQRIIMVSSIWVKGNGSVCPVDLCIDKPVDLPELMMGIRHVLNGHAPWEVFKPAVY